MLILYHVKLVLTDLTEKGGVLVNGKPVKGNKILADGDKITLADRSFIIGCSKGCCSHAYNNFLMFCYSAVSRTPQQGEEENFGSAALAVHDNGTKQTTSFRIKITLRASACRRGISCEG